MKKVLFWMVLTILSSLGLSVSPALADGVHGVRETAREILVEVPKFCRPLKTVWEVRWEQKSNSEDALDAILASMQKEKGAKVTSYYLQSDALKLSASWQGNRTYRIPKFDAKGNPIKIGFLSILAVGGGEKLLNKNNWVFIFADGRVVDISPPVNDGTWGKCT